MNIVKLDSKNACCKVSFIRTTVNTNLVSKCNIHIYICTYYTGRQSIWGLVHNSTYISLQGKMFY